MRRHISPLVLVAILAVGCATPSNATPSPPSASQAAAPSSPATPRPIVIDADLDHSDIAAILVLLRDPAVDVLAIAIDGTGLVHCQGGRLVTGYLLDELGITDIPYGCGRQNGGEDARPFPDDWRATADAGYGLDITPSVQTEFPPDAVDLIRDAVDSRPGEVTLVTLGPLTNLEDAFAADPTLPDRVAGIHAMLGTVEAPGNVYIDGLTGTAVEWNAFADPSAVEAVFATDVPISIVPLDATDDVPVPADLTERIASDHAAAGVDLMYELLLRNPSRLNGAEGQQLWDELAALAVSAPDLVTWQDATVTVEDRGRLATDPAGRPIRYAAAADGPAVETALLEALRRGGPRTTPFELAGQVHVMWDGSTCAMTVDGDGPGLYTLEYQGLAGTPSSVVIAGLRDARPWSELEAFLATIDLSTIDQPPDWVVTAGQANDEPGAGTLVTSTVELEAGIVGPICASGRWPDVAFTAGEPALVGD
jgi:pyrimidine-specific ribonucleoside hydrolase